MASALKVSRVQKRGQVTIPIEIRERMGLEEGDLVAFVETKQGVLLSPQAVVPAHTVTQRNPSERASDVGLPDLFAFSDRLANGSLGEKQTAAKPKKGASIAERTAGIFAHPDRGPIDFEAARQEFVEDTARRTHAKLARDDE